MDKNQSIFRCYFNKKNQCIHKKYNILIMNKLQKKINALNVGIWELVIGNWGLGIGNVYF
jgi:hypothetical protein